MSEKYLFFSSKLLHQFENLLMCKFVHCTTVWKIKTASREKRPTKYR